MKPACPSAHSVSASRRATSCSYDRGASHALFATRPVQSVVDVALVLDTTGSMGDEINALKRTIDIPVGGHRERIIRLYDAHDYRGPQNPR